VPDQRFDHLAARVLVPEQARQGALDRRALQPPDDQRERAQLFVAQVVQRVQ